MTPWMAVILCGGLFALVRGVVDLRRRRFVWGGLGILVGLMLLLTPIPTFGDPMKVELPAARH